MTSGGVQIVHGLRLRGAPPMAGAATDDGGEVDFVVEVAPPAPPSGTDLTGELVAERKWRSGGYSAVRRDGVVQVRFEGVADFEVNTEGHAMRLRAAPGTGEELAPLFLAGVVLAVVLGLRSVPVFHASAVEVDGGAVAFAGHVGAGKTTAAALLCAAGGLLISDDSLRLEERDDTIVAHRGLAHLRLRSGAAVLAERAGGASYVTQDGRTGAPATPPSALTSPLSAVALPRWQHETREPAVQTLRPRDALEALLRFPRVAGWQTAEPMRAHFHACADIVQRTPVFDVALPARGLGDEGLADALLDRLAAAGALG